MPDQIVQKQSDGTYHVLHDDGTVTPLVKVGKEPQFKGTTDSWNIQPPKDVMDQKPLGPLDLSNLKLRDVTSGLGSILGLSTGGGVGSIPLAVGGGMAGREIGVGLEKGLHSVAPNTFEPPPDYGKINEEHALDAMLNTLFGGASYLYGMKEPIKEAIKAKFLSKVSRPLPSQTLEAFGTLKKEGIPTPTLSVGTPEGHLAKVLEDIAVPEKKLALIGKQQQEVKDIGKKVTGLDFENLPLPSTQGTEGIQSARKVYDQLKQAENVAWNDKLRPAIPKITVRVPTGGGESISTGVMGADGKMIMKQNPITYETKEMRAIPLPNTIATAQKLQKNINEVFSQYPGEVATDRVKRSLGELKNNIDLLLTPQQHVGDNGVIQNLPIKDFDTAKRIVSSIESLTKGVLNKTEAEGSLKALANSLRQDMSEGLTPEAKTLWEEAKAATKKRFATFPEQMEKAVFGNPSEFFNKTLRTPEDARALVNATGGRDPAKKAFLSDFLDRMTDKTQPSRFMDTGRALSEWNSRENQDLIKEFMTPKEVNRIKNFFEVANTVSPKLSMTGKVALAIREGGLMINIPGALADTLTKGKLSGYGIRSGIGLSAIFKGKDLVDKVLMNPENAQIALGLLKAPPRSTFAIQGARKLFAALKGAEVTFEDRESGKPVATFEIPK